MFTKLAVGVRATKTAWLIAGVLALAAIASTGRAAVPGPLLQDEAAEEKLLELDFAFTSKRTAGSTPIDLTQAGELRGKAAVAAKKLRDQQIPSATSTFGGAWTQIGPNPIVQVLQTSQSFG